MLMTAVHLRLFACLIDIYVQRRKEALQALETKYADAERCESLWARSECLAGKMTEVERDAVWAECDKRLELLDNYLFKANYDLKNLKSIYQSARKQSREAIGEKSAP